MKATKKTAFQNWLTTFLAEKNLPFRSWTLLANNGVEHHIDSDVVTEAIMHCSPAEQKSIKKSIVKIDFMNGDVNHFFRHLAQGLACGLRQRNDLARFCECGYPQ